MGNKKFKGTPTFDNESIGDVFTYFILMLEKATGQEVLLEEDKNHSIIVYFEDDPLFEKISKKQDEELKVDLKNLGLSEEQINKLYDPRPYLDENKINGLKNLAMKNDFKPDEPEIS
jgi:hypothetical protein